MCLDSLQSSSSVLIKLQKQWRMILLIALQHYTNTLKTCEDTELFHYDVRNNDTLPSNSNSKQQDFHLQVRRQLVIIRLFIH